MKSFEDSNDNEILIATDESLKEVAEYLKTKIGFYELVKNLQKEISDYCENN